MERKNRVRWKPVAPIAEKKTKRSTPARSAERSRRTVASPLSSSIVPPGWSRIVAARWITVSTPRIAWRIEKGSREVAERDLDVDPVLAELPRVADEHAHLVALGEQRGQQLAADHAGCSREQDHAATVASRPAGDAAEAPALA